MTWLLKNGAWTVAWALAIGAWALTAGLALAADNPATDNPQTIDVWPGPVPGESGESVAETVEQKGGPLKLISNVTRPTLTIFRPASEKDTGAAVVICPGGGYSVLAWDLEGEEVATWLNSIGVTGIVLKYRVPAHPGKPGHAAPLQDAQRAMSLLRSRASEWGIDPQRIGMLGFSAGGNLTARACTNYAQRTYDAIDEIDKVSCRPDFAVLIYPAWLNKEDKDELIADLPVDNKTPPMFLAHAGDDGIMADGSVIMYLALKRAKVPAELHVYASGGHGFGLRPSAHASSTWPGSCAQWLAGQKLLLPKKSP